MKIIAQKVSQASVGVINEENGLSDNTFIPQTIQTGLVLLVGVSDSDGQQDIAYAARKIAHMRIFQDQDGKMNQSVIDVGGEILSISQFTLFADCKHGNRPSFIAAGHPEHAKKMWEGLNKCLEEYGIVVKTGRFGSHMKVSLTNDGPVTIPIDTDLLLHKPPKTA